MTQSLTGNVIIDKLAMDFEIFNEFKMISVNMPPIYFVDHVELSVFDKEMNNYEVPFMEKWKIVEKFRWIKYKLYQLRNLYRVLK